MIPTTILIDRNLLTNIGGINASTSALISGPYTTTAYWTGAGLVATFGGGDTASYHTLRGV